MIWSSLAARAVGVVVLGAATILVSVACSHDVAIDDWLKRADDVCRQEQASADANPAPASPLPGDELRVLAQHSRDQVDGLRDLPPPDSQKSSVSEYLLTLQHRVEVLGNFADEIDQAPAEGPAPDRSRLEDATSQANTQAVALGLQVCGGGLDLAVSTTTTEALLGGGGVGAGSTVPVGNDDIDTPDVPG